jgi:RNA polymerase sigma-70 factor (ECF subfamily)
MADDKREDGHRAAESGPLGLRAACFRVGCEQWPRIRWTEGQFDAAWNTFEGAVEGGDDAQRDEYLRLACLARVPGAVETLETEFLTPLTPILLKRTGDADIADEALQRLRQKLLLGDRPRLASYRSTGHLRAWLQVVAIRLCQDVGRQRGAQWEREAPLAEQWLGGGIHPETRLEKGELDELFVAALREVIRQLPERERYALRMHVLAKWNVTQIGEALSTHRATAARWIVSAKQRLNDNVRALLRQRLDLDPAELDRLFTLLSTQFDMRLSQVFNTTTALGLIAAEGESGETQPPGSFPPEAVE